MTDKLDIAQVRTYLVGLQARITDTLNTIDPTPFVTDAWEKPAGEKLQGNGITKIMEGGPVFERAGCGFSHVTGPQLPPSATQHRPELAARLSRPWACHWCFTPATRTCPRCT